MMPAQREGWSTGGDGKRLDSLDGLRTFSIALVLVGHGLPYATREALGDLGNLGVRWFFVISGLLITRLLLIEGERTGGISLSRFYVRRALRIFPAFYAYLLVMFAIQMLGLIEPITPRSWAHALTYTVNYQAVGTRSWYVAHLWSLAVEEQFYLLWPFFLLVLGRARGMVAVATTAMLVPLWRMAMVTWFPDRVGDIPWHFETVCDSLATGCLLAGTRDWLWRQGSYRRWLTAPRVAAVFAGVFVVSWLSFRRQRVGFLVGQTGMNLGIAFCIDFCLRHRESLAGRFLNWRPVAYLGTLSYSIYLWQQPFFQESPSVMTRFPVNVALALAAAWASHRLVEQPFLRLKERVARRT